MSRSQIDFAPRSWQRTAYRTTLLAYGLTALGLVLCVTAAFAARALLAVRDVEAEAVQRIQRAEATWESRAAAPKKPTITDAQAVAVNAAVAQLNLPWYELLDALEAATPKSIALIALEPDAQKHHFKGTAESKTSDGMVAYIERLKREPFLSGVLLTKHEINDRDPNKPLRFQFEAAWRPEAK